jgi:hypothetical protein
VSLIKLSAVMVVIMLPIVWFYIALVISLWGLLFYVELRKQARCHVRGCPSLIFISPRRLSSLIIMEPDLKILELAPHPSNEGIPDARQLSSDQLEEFLSRVSRSTILVFFDSTHVPANWRRVEILVRKHGLRNTFVLKGGLEAWQAFAHATPQIDNGFSSHSVDHV